MLKNNYLISFAQNNLPKSQKNDLEDIYIYIYIYLFIKNKLSI